MAADDPASGIMPASELKPLLVLSKRQPVSCAIGLTRDKQAIVLLHRRTKPRKLLAELRKQASAAGVALDAASLRFGRASVDGGSDSTMVTFTVNKPAPGPLRIKLLERLRPAGFQRCEIVVDEALENEGEDDAPGDDADAGPADGAAPRLPGGSGEAASNGADALKGELTRLVRQIAPVIAADPSQKERLLTLANDANARRKAGDAEGTQAGIAALRRALSPPSLAPMASTAPAHDTGQTRQPANGPTVPPALGFLAPAAPAVVEGGGAALFAGGAATGLLAGAGVGGMLLGPQMELQGMAAHARTNAFWAATRELGQVDPANRDAAPFVANPGWQPSDADVQRIEAALADAKAAKACTAGNPTGAPSGHGTPMPGPTLPGSDLLATRPRPAKTPAPPAATAIPSQPPPMVAPDPGFEHDPDDPDEADLVVSMHGRPGTEIQNAIDDLRARKRGKGLPVNATGRRRPAEPVPNALAPADRHYLNRIRLNSQPKAKNTVILPGTDIQPDVQAIREGRALRDGPYYVVGDRYYETHEGGRLYPVQGTGFIMLDRGAFRALCILISLGDTPAAELMLDRQGISEEQRRAARSVREQQ